MLWVGLPNEMVERIGECGTAMLLDAPMGTVNRDLVHEVWEALAGGAACGAGDFSNVGEDDIIPPQS